MGSELWLTEETNLLLDVLGNDNRRKILKLLALEPRYLLQLAEELGVSQQAVLKHLALLEKYGVISSYAAPGDMPGPLRKYYKLSKSVCLAFEMTEDSVDFKLKVIPGRGVEVEEEAEGEGFGNFADELQKLEAKVSALDGEVDRRQVLYRCNEILRGLNEELDDLERVRVRLLTLKQMTVNKAHQTIRNLSIQDLERRILYWVLGSEDMVDVEQLSVEFDVREKEIRSAVAQLQKKLLLQIGSG